MPAAVERPDIEIGAVLIFERGEVRTCTHRLRLRIEAVRDDLSAFYTDAIWLEGQSLSADGSPSGRTQALAEVSAIPRAIRRGSPPAAGGSTTHTSPGAPSGPTVRR